MCCGAGIGVQRYWYSLGHVDISKGEPRGL